MAERGSDLDLMKEQARQKRAEEAKQLQRKMNIMKEDEISLKPEQENLFGGVRRVETRDGISMQAERALGKYNHELMKLSNKICLYGVDQQPMTPLPDQKPDNPLISGGKVGEGVRKDLFKERKHLGYQEYIKQKQRQESSSSVENSSESSQRSMSAKSHREGSSNLPVSSSEKSHSGDKVSSSHQRRSSKDRAGHSTNSTHSSFSKSQNRADQHNISKPQVSKVPFHSPSPVKKNHSTISNTHTPKKDEVLKTISCHDETSSVTSKILKDVQPPRNGMINGAKHFKPKPPVNLPKLDIKEAQNLAESTDVESILKEMTRSVGAPLTAIHTPRKEEAKFPFPAPPSKKNHVTESTQLKTKHGGQDGSTSQTKVNHETAEGRQKSGKEKSSEESRSSETPDVPRPRSKPPGPSGGSGTNAPTKEPRSVSSSESDDSSDNDSSGDSNEESSSSSEEESEKEEVPAELPKAISPLISPPAKPNESKNSSISSWSLDSLINQFNNTQSPITPLSSSSSSKNSDRKNDPRSPHKDENDEMLSKFITSEIIDKDNGPTEISHISPLPQSPPYSSACKWTSASLHNSSESANSKSPRVSHSSQNAHKSRDKKSDRTVDSVGAFGIKKRKSSYSSDGSYSHKSQVRTPQKDIKSSTPNSSKSSKHRNSTHKSPVKSTLTDSDDSDVDIESFTPGKDAIPTALLNKADVTKRLFNSDKSESVVKSENVVRSEKLVKSENIVRSENVVKSENIVRSENVKNETIVKSESTRKNDKNRNVSKPNNKSKERTKEKPRRQKSYSSDIKEQTPVNCDVKTNSSTSLNGSGSIEKDVRNIFSEIGSEKLNLLSPIPNLPEKSNVLYRSTNTSKSVLDFQKCLTYKNGKPSIMVHLSLSLLPKPWNTSSPFVLDSKSEKYDKFVISPQKESVRIPQNPVIDNSDNENTTEYGDSDMELDSPDSTVLIETPNPLEQHVKRDYIPVESRLTTPDSRISPVFSAHSPRHRKSSKRKQDSDRIDDQKRPKPARNNTPIEKESPQKEKESHKDSREWDWKHPRRSEVKVRRDSSSSLSSQPGSASLKQTKTQGTEPDEPLVKSEVKANELEEKVEELVVHDQNGARFPTNGYPSSNEMQNWYREGDRDGDDLLPSPRYPKLHKQRLEDRLESADTYLAEAKKLKHQADNLNDKPAKTLTYLEAVLSFIQCGYAMEKEAISDMSKIHKMYMETYRLISHIFRSRSSHDFNHNMTRKERILAVLSLRIQSLLCLKLFKLRKAETLKLKRAIDDYNKPSSKPAHAPSPHQSGWNGRSTVTPSHSSPTPSPAGSIGSVDSQGSDLIPSKLPNGNAASCVSMSSPAPGVVSVPQRIHSLTQQYVNMTNFLVQCHDFWDQADVAMQEYQEFFEEVDEQCGALSLHSSILDLVFYVQSGLQKLKDV